LIFFVGAIVGVFNEYEYWLGYVLLIYGGCAFAFYMARWRRSFLFLLYAFLAGYMATTYLLFRTIFSSVPELWFYYSVLSCAGFVYFIIRFKTFLKQA
jgi:hypothetical protein